MHQKTEKAYVVDRRQSKAHSAIYAKAHIQFPFPVLPNSPVASSTCICHQPTYARHDGYGFCGYILDVPRRSSSFNNNFLNYFLHASIFYQPVWTPKATFQTVENNFPDRARIFRQLTFFTFHRTYFTLQRWTGKCWCRALITSTLIRYCCNTNTPKSKHFTDLQSQDPFPSKYWHFQLTEITLQHFQVINPIFRFRKVHQWVAKSTTHLL